MLVETSGEVGVQQSTIVDRFADDATDKFEERKVVGVDVRHAIGLVCGAVCCTWLEQCVIWIEHGSR
jgi:hypothetical protein